MGQHRNRRRRSSQNVQRQRKVRRMILCVQSVILIGLLAAAVVIGMKKVGSSSGESSAEVKENNAVTEAKADSTDGGTPQAAADGSEKTAEKEEKTGADLEQTEPVDDRSEFAVQPGRTVGSSEQSEEKVVYLTLDDGPSQNTQAVLDILDKYNAKATFFVTGEMLEYKDMIKVAYDKGHTIGMHTYSHKYEKVYASVDAYFADLDQIGQLVKEQIGYVPCFIRFPGGSSNSISKKYTTGIMTELVKQVQERGYQYYDWNGSSGDGAVKTTEELINQGISYGDHRNIVFLSHDSAAKQTTVEALPTIIEYYQSQGYVFKALDLNSYTAHHGVNN